MVNKKSKTVSEIVQEHVNRQKAPQYKEIGIISNANQEYSYSNVTNLKDEEWIEFDSKYKGNMRHIKIKGQIIRYVEAVDTEPVETVPRNYSKVILYTHSGKREIYTNVSNLVENIFDAKVEFDTINNFGEKVHVIKNPGNVEHSEEILKLS